jgi:Protein of unknown function/AsmA-like C-terminal region
LADKDTTPHQDPSWLRFMQHLKRTEPVPAEPALEDEAPRLLLQRSRSHVLVWLGRLAGVMSICFLLLLGALWMLQVRLAEGPINVNQFMPQIAHDIENRIGEGYRVKMADASIERTQYGATLAVSHFILLDPQGQSVIDAPRADVSINLWTLPLGIFRPSHIEVYDIAVHLIVLADGSFTIAAGKDTSEVDQATQLPPLPNPPLDQKSGPPPQPNMEHEVQNLLDTILNPDGILGGLEHVTVTHGALYFDDRVNQQITKFDHLDLAYDKTNSTARIDLEADGPNGRWHITASGDTLANVPRSFSLNIKDLSLDELSLMTGAHDIGIDFDMPLSVVLGGQILPDGHISEIKGAFSIGAGFLFNKDPDQEPFWIDEATSHIEWNKDTESVLIKDVQIFSADTTLSFTGTLSVPQNPNESWLLDLKGLPSNMIGPQRSGDHKISVSSSALKLRINALDKIINLDSLRMNGPELSADLSGEIGFATDHHFMHWDGVFNKVPTSVALMLWPSVSAAPVRNFMQGHLHGGMLEKLTLHADLDEASLTEMKYQRPPLDESISVDFSLTNTNLHFLDNAPPLSNVEAIGHVTGRTALIKIPHAQIDMGGGKKLNLSDGVFSVADTGIKPTPAHITTHLNGSLDALGDLLSRDALKKYGGVQIDTTTIKGQVESDLTIDMLLTRPDQNPQVVVQATSNVSNFVIERVLGKEKIDNGTLNVVYENNSLRATGQGHILGSPATIELQKPADTLITQASISFVLDDAARAHMGYGQQGLSGPVNVHLMGALGQSDKSTAQVELDFTKAALDNLIPGLVKPAGRQSKAEFAVVTDGDHLHVDQFNFDAGNGLGLKGAFDLDETGSLSAAHLTQVKLSGSDDAHLDYERNDTLTKLSLRGTSFDAHAFITKLTNSDSKSADNDGQRDVDVDIRLGQMTGANHKSVTALELHYSRRLGVARAFTLSARSGRAQIDGQLKRADDGQDVLYVTSPDAGSFLSFLDLYKHMESGQLTLSARVHDGGVDGLLYVNNFVVRDEPALRRIVSEGQERSTSGTTQLNNINTTVAPFERLQIGFIRKNGILTIKDAVMYGQQIGMNIDGKIDFAHDAVNLTGTFVPAYGLNNLVSKIPLFGPVLLGGQHEGLFAINFRINGSANAPLLTINPLSAIAPGFLRKIFGVIDNGLTNSLPAGSEDMPMSITPQPRH